MVALLLYNLLAVVQHVPVHLRTLDIPYTTIMPDFLSGEMGSNLTTCCE